MRGVPQVGGLVRGHKSLTVKIAVLRNGKPDLGFKFFAFGFRKILEHHDGVLRRIFFHGKSDLAK